jgi:4'-phosphopantetheinyl transferase
MSAFVRPDRRGSLALDPDEVHVWLVPVARSADEVAPLERTLSHDERQRAARFYFERDRIAFITARGALRVLAGRYLDRPPTGLVFAYRERGKPYLAPPVQGLQFNLSHSGELALLAFGCAREVGVDIERRRAVQDLRALAELSFSREEYAAWCALSPGDQPGAFFSCWARKEAFIKATGEGISQLADFDVSVHPDQPARLLRVAGEPPSQPRWTLHDLPQIAGYAAALVVEGSPDQITCWDSQVADLTSEVL